ncbi:adenosylhomocysteinase [Caldisericum exile]|uniref:Adenosylhomocysteinase n=1 Tax=Caldisericum exile (strain DSM 21853 / NBRC 104410 / AZM16c01) TaxID=511051 RepID=A0A7U6GE11_CALEA|nr:adenosylhomocysteinase [Caldisericum exile]BAL80678.1 adenosylhomocysteinase [Caldisericum exile AZM16c01]
MNEGEKKLEWAFTHMKILQKIKDDFEKRKPFKGINIALSIHLEAKTANLAKVLKIGGANIYVSGSNPLTTQDDVADALRNFGIPVFARRGEQESEHLENINKTLDVKPHIVIDDGGDLVHLLHYERKELLKNVIGACEETTTGVIRNKALENAKLLKFPVIAVNNGKCKHLFDNRYGTGQSTWDAIMRTTNLNIAGKNVVVVGYGWVGKGVAMRARGLGARVIVTEVDPIKAIEAYMDGFDVMEMKNAAKVGDIFVTTTGNTNVIDSRHFELLKDGAILTNAGHFNVEIAMDELEKEKVSKREVRQNIMEYTLKNGRHIYVLGEGRLVNLACADGHPIEIMDLSFALQALSAEYLLTHQLENKVYDVPEEIDIKVANIFLEANGIKIDKLTKKQIDYLTKPH